MNYIARFENVGYTYNKGVSYETKAVCDVTLGIEKGTVTGIIGATGSGKSTLIQMLNGLVKPECGKVFVDGVDIWDKKVKMRDIRFKVGLVMQYPEYQLFDETVGGDIAFGPKNMGISGDELKVRVEKAASFAGLDFALLGKSPFDLSGGQKRRAALAGVMAMEPDLLVLDEPAAGLDPVGRRDILGKIKNYKNERETSVIIVSHSMEDIAKYCDRLVVMSSGRVIANGATEEVFSRHAELSAEGLDVPEITKTAYELEKLGVEIGEDIYTVKYAAERLIEKYSIGKGGVLHGKSADKEG